MHEKEATTYPMSLAWFHAAKAAQAVAYRLCRHMHTSHYRKLKLGGQISRQADECIGKGTIGYAVGSKAYCSPMQD